MAPLILLIALHLLGFLASGLKEFESHRGKGKVLATVYKRRDVFRLYSRARAADGMRKSYMQYYSTYSKAKRAAEKVVADLSKGRAACHCTNAR